MSVDHLLRRSIHTLKPYVPGLQAADVARRYGLSDVIKLASNEHPLGPSPRAVAAMTRALADGHLYPPENWDQLRNEIAGHSGVDPAGVVLGNGSDNCLLMTMLTFLNEGDQALIPLPTFPMYETLVRVVGGEPVPLPTPGLKQFDLSHILDHVTDRIKVVFLCNPNNPTGTVFTASELDEFLERLAARAIVILDEAYIEFADYDDMPDAARVIRRWPNVIAVRTFSKVYGLAGLRLGYVMACPDTAARVAQVREPLCVNAAAYAGAMAALGDRDYVQLTVETVRKAREELYRGLEELGIEYIPSQTNFVLANLGRPCPPIVEQLAARGVIVRAGTMWDLEQWIRISIGTSVQIEQFLIALAQVMT